MIGRIKKKVLTAMDLLAGWPFGRTFPPRPTPPFPSVDPRTVALRILALYVSELTFLRPGDLGGAPIELRIPYEDIHVEQPDAEDDTRFPSIVLKDTNGGDYTTIGLTSFIDEKTKDLYGKGTALLVMTEYNETITLEIWATHRSERRSILAGLEAALVPTEQMYGIRFRMPDYYDQTVCFTLNRSTRLDDQYAGQGRRVARVDIEMRFNIVRPVNVVEIDPALGTEFIGTDPTAFAAPDTVVGSPPPDPKLA